LVGEDGGGGHCSLEAMIVESRESEVAGCSRSGIVVSMRNETST